MDQLIQPSQSQQTYDRLISAAIKQFAVLGPEATTRDIAREADVVQSSISYHFGTKTELYRAALQHAANMMAKPIAPELARIRKILARKPGIEKLTSALMDLMSNVAEIMLTPGEEAASAQQLVMRELIIPTGADELVMHSVVQPIVALATDMLRLLNIPVDSEGDEALEATVLFGPITIFRVLYNRDFTTMNAARARSIQNVVREATRRDILALAASAKAARRSEPDAKKHLSL